MGSPVIIDDPGALAIRPLSPRELQTGEPHRRTDYDFLTLTVGSKMDVSGVMCVVTHINQGRRRITMSPVSSLQNMPVKQVADPITKVHKGAKRGR